MVRAKEIAVKFSTDDRRDFLDTAISQAGAGCLSEKISEWGQQMHQKLGSLDG